MAPAITFGADKPGPPHAISMDRPMRCILIIAATLGAVVCPASAQEHRQSGRDLIEACRSIARGTLPTPDNALQAGVCLGEIEALNWFAGGVNDENLRSCVPEPITPQQQAKVIVAYLDQQSVRLREPFEGLALEALALTWPCAEESGWFGKWLHKAAPAE
jgi:hypothetical protein